jgi:hypothetical protein
MRDEHAGMRVGCRERSLALLFNKKNINESDAPVNA